MDILTHKLFNLSEVSGISKETKDIISSVDLELVKSDDGIWVSNRGYSPNELMEFWRSEDALQLFFGRVFEKDSTVVARTSVHFGGLSHGLPQNGYRMEIPLTQDQYDTTRDSHSAVIMYALSLFQLGLLNDQSAVDCSEPQVSRELISLAKNYALDAAKNQQKLKEVEKAIDEVAKLFGQNCK
ncbi:hypothetical protein [Roseibium sp.]|uniref:hypothetical protein n=1 Tax=Roseibium sp. TaxID=1936156 RepID=UPI003BAC6CD9